MTTAERYFRQVVQRECCKPIECTHTLHDNRCENRHDDDDVPVPSSHPLPPLNMTQTFQDIDINVT